MFRLTSSLDHVIFLRSGSACHPQQYGDRPKYQDFPCGTVFMPGYHSWWHLHL